MKSRILIWALVGATGGALVFTAAQNVFARERETGKPVAVAVQNTPPNRDGRLAASYAAVVKKTSPAVVNIFTTKTIRSPFGSGGNPFFEDPMFRRFFGVPDGGSGGPRFRDFKQRSLGSGVILSADGYLVTNHHVVDGADEIQVAMAESRKEYPARVVGRDPRTDLALLKIDAESLPFATFADSDHVEVGDVVLAIGNPFGVGQTVTLGIVSAVGRGGLGIEEYEDFIQTDAAINPGNSGGALVDTEGRVVGINVAIMSPSGGNNGVGFAIPANQVRSVVDQLSRKGSVDRGFLGVGLQEMTPDLAREFGVGDTGGALVAEVTEESAAAEAGLRQGDVIVEFDGKPVRDGRGLRLLVGQKSPGTEVTLKYLRDGKEKSTKVALQRMPGTPGSEATGPESSSDDAEALRGVGVTDLTPEIRRQLQIPARVTGAVIASVDPDSAAAGAGLRRGDVIQEIDRKPVKSAEDAVQITKKAKNGKVLVRVWRATGHSYVVVDESKK